MAKRPRPGVILGLIVALAIPVSNFLVALLWQLGGLNLGPGGAHGENNALVQTLFSTVGWEGVLGPAGIAIGGWSTGLRGAGAWRRFLIVAAPGLFVLWLVAALYLSFVNGTLF